MFLLSHYGTTIKHPRQVQKPNYNGGKHNGTAKVADYKNDDMVRLNANSADKKGQR